MGKKILVTGGAGFIGSHIVNALLELDVIEKVRVIDNLSTGNRTNIAPFFAHSKFEFVWGDIREYNTCLEVIQNVDLICHQAALGSVPRSIKNPLTTNSVNVGGTLNIFNAAKDLGIKRIVYAASSSTYGDSNKLPKREEVIGSPMSPYSVTKLVNELYANVYAQLYDIEFIGLRYFNVFGPRQDPNGAYAAVIPLFIKAILDGTPPRINGDGLQSRDFTFVDNAVQANIKALFTTNGSALNQVYNIAVGENITIIDLFNEIKTILNSTIEPSFGPSRAGDVRHSLADISKAMNYIDYYPSVNVKDGLKVVVEHYKEYFNSKA